jgi:hypothetical protein
VALIDPDEFERAKLLAAAEWQRMGEKEIASAFGHLKLTQCGFGMHQNSRTCWAVVKDVRIFLAFGLESGEYERSFIVR